MLLISPFSRKGLACSRTFDHTSLLCFLERRFGPEVPNLSRWRRAWPSAAGGCDRPLQPDCWPRGRPTTLRAYIENAGGTCAPTDRTGLTVYITGARPLRTRDRPPVQPQPFDRSQRIRGALEISSTSAPASRTRAVVSTALWPDPMTTTDRPAKRSGSATSTEWITRSSSISSNCDGRWAKLHKPVANTTRRAMKR